MIYRIVDHLGHAVVPNVANVFWKLLYNRSANGSPYNVLGQTLSRKGLRGFLLDGGPVYASLRNPLGNKIAILYESNQVIVGCLA